MLPKFNINSIDELKDAVNEKISIAIIDEVIEAQLVLLHSENLLEHKLIQAAVDLNVDKMASLLEEGANPDFMLPEYFHPYENKSALHKLADDYGLWSHNVTLFAIKVLLDNGANPNLVTEQGDASLHILTEKAYSYHGANSQIEIFDLLLNHGANLYLKNLAGNSPADYLMNKSNFAIFLEKHKPPLNLSDIYYRR